MAQRSHQRRSGQLKSPKRGRPRPVNDSWIAAVCLTYELPLATRNVKDFEDYEGLEIITA